MLRKKDRKLHMLPLEDVEIGAWPEQNFLFGIICQQKNGMDWLLNHFIQLRGAHYIDYRWEARDASITFYPYSIHQLTPNMFDLCPFIQKYTIPKSFVRARYGKLHKFVMDAINAGYYISTFLDQFFRTDMAGNHGFRHPTFIYGYDAARRMIFIADNFENGKYGRKEITFEQLNRGFDLVSGEIWEVSVFLYQTASVDYQFVPEYVKEQLEDYLYPNRGVCYFNRTVCPEPFHCDENYSNEVFFGLHCYDLLEQCLEGVAKGDSNYARYDWRSLVQLCDHKHLMVKRYEYLSEKKITVWDSALHQGLADLEKQCLIAQNMYVKFSVSDDERIILRLMDRLRDIRERDRQTVERLLEKFSK